MMYLKSDAESYARDLVDVMVEDINKKNGVENLEEVERKQHTICTFLLWIQRERNKIKDNVKSGKPFEPIRYGGEDFQMLLLKIINSLIHDRYYEKDDLTSTEGKAKPSWGVRYAFLLWMTMMEYRYWKRKHLIENKDGMLYRQTRVIRHILKGICDVPGMCEDKKVVEWNPERVFIAMTKVSESRIKYPHPTKEDDINMFHLYMGALLDMVCLFMRTPQLGPVDRLSPSNLDWYMAVEEMDTTSHLNEREVALSGTKAVQREIELMRERQRRENESVGVSLIHENRNARRSFRVGLEDLLQNFSTYTDEIADLEEKRGLFKSMMEGYHESAPEYPKARDDFEKTDAALEYMKKERDNHADIIRSKIQSMEDKSALNMEHLALIMKNIDLMTKTHQGGGASSLTEEDASEQEDARLQLAEMGKNSTRSGKYLPTVVWYKDNMVLSMHLLTRHYKDVAVCNQIVASPLHMQILQAVRPDVFQTVGYANEKEGVIGAERFIMEVLQTQPWERVYYKQSLRAKAVFRVMDAWSYARGLTSGMDSMALELPGYKVGDFESETNLFYFLEKKNRHPYHHEVASYVINWWLKQKYPMLNVNRSFYMWDIENEFISLYRKPLKAPVMSKIGKEWVVLKPDGWYDPEKRGLNVIWCGVDPFYCLMEFIVQLRRNQWVLVLRGEDKYQAYNLKGTHLEKLVETFLSISR